MHLIGFNADFNFGLVVNILGFWYNNLELEVLLWITTKLRNRQMKF